VIFGCFSGPEGRFLPKNGRKMGEIEVFNVKIDFESSSHTKKYFLYLVWTHF
jgi:hypothetical protein